MFPAIPCCSLWLTYSVWLCFLLNTGYDNFLGVDLERFHGGRSLPKVLSCDFTCQMLREGLLFSWGGGRGEDGGREGT